MDFDEHVEKCVRKLAGGALDRRVLRDLQLLLHFGTFGATEYSTLWRGANVG